MGTVAKMTIEQTKIEKRLGLWYVRRVLVVLVALHLVSGTLSAQTLNNSYF